MKKKTKEVIIVWIIGIILLFHAIAWAAFEVRNPICNEMAFFTNYINVVTFKELEYFQIKE